MKRIIDFIKRYLKKQKIRSRTKWQRVHHTRGRVPTARQGVPRWVEETYRKSRYTKGSLPYRKVFHIKGKHYGWKIVVHMPQIQGEEPRTYYKRKRIRTALKELEKNE